MMRQKTLLISALLIVIGMMLVFVSVTRESPSVQVGVIDDEHIFRKSSVALMLGSTVYRELKGEIKAVNRLANSARALEQSLADNFARLTPKEVARQKALVEERKVEAIKRRQELNAKLGEAMGTQRDAMSAKLKEAARRVAAVQQLSAVVRKSELLYYDEASNLHTVDITGAIINELKGR